MMPLDDVVVKFKPHVEPRPSILGHEHTELVLTVLLHSFKRSINIQKIAENDTRWFEPMQICTKKEGTGD